MSAFGRRYLLLVGVLAISMLVNIAYRNIPREWSELPRLQEFPEQVGEWKHVGDITMDRRVVDVLGADGLIFREYQNPLGESVILCIMYHVNDRYGAHSPEICYTSQGWDIQLEGSRQTKRVALPDSHLEANEFTVEKGDQRQIVLYWFFGSGKRQTPSRTLQMLANAGHRLTHSVSVSGFVRVSSPIAPLTEAGSMKRATEFADRVAVAIPSYLP
jgi:EpsI family protein